MQPGRRRLQLTDEADKRTDMSDNGQRTADTGETDHRQIVWMKFLNVLRCGGHSAGNRKTFPSNAQLSKNSKLGSRMSWRGPVEGVIEGGSSPGLLQMAGTCSATL